MRFTEVTERLGATVRHPGHPDDGLPLTTAIPSLGNVRVWQAVHGGYTWVIMHEPGLDAWGAEHKAQCGYTASYRKVDHKNSSQTIRIDGAPWNTFAAAEAECQRVWKQIRRPQ